ncbi:MAG: Sua5/YciO/YrdC/YwlC family protein, partial [Myxococcota bacterium]
MKTITLQNVQDHSDIIEQVCAVLEEGGVACLPMNGNYRLLADLNNTSAVIRLFQSKRRVKEAPSLVFVPDPGRLREVAADVSDTAAQLATQFWPGPLTLVLERRGEGVA